MNERHRLRGSKPVALKTTAVFACLLLLSAADASEWARFRGPNGEGISPATGVPTTFDRDKGTLWQTVVPSGHSSPILSKDRLFLTAYEEKRLLSLALDRQTGKILWRREAPRPREGKFHRLNGPASASPVTDGESVFVFFGDFGLVSYDLDGNSLWQRPLGPFLVASGQGSSPILAGGHLILQVDQDRDSYILAMDPKDGSDNWKVERPEATHGYSTPTIFTPEGGEPQLIVTSSYHTASYALDDGEKLWWAYGSTWQSKPSPVTTSDTVFVTGSAPGGDPGQQVELPPFAEAIERGDADGDGKLSEDEVKTNGWRHRGGWGLIDLDDDGLLGRRDWKFFRARRSAHNTTLAIRPSARRGDITESAVVWSYRRGIPEVPCPIVHDGILYVVKNGGILTALDGESGEVLKQARLPGATGQYYASPIIADSRLYFVSEDGKVSVVRPGEDWEVMAMSDLGEHCYATPAVADGVMYVRTETRVYAFVAK